MNELQTRTHVMSIIPLLAQSAFEPETVEFLVSVYEAAWQRVEQSGSKLASPAYQRAAQEILAKRIIENAQRGERDPKVLADDAVSFLNVLTRDNRDRTADQIAGHSIVKVQEPGLEARALPIGQLPGAFLLGQPAQMGWREQRLLPGVEGDDRRSVRCRRPRRRLASSDRLDLGNRLERRQMPAP